MDFFSSVYEGTPPWDIGHPQREFVQLEEADEIKGSVLDVGCGTGENALYLAERGHEVWGVDFSPPCHRESTQQGRPAAPQCDVSCAGCIAARDVRTRLRYGY
ncbi:MAG: class I SAM-dependent methyltransferase [Halobacteriota archaeon]